MSDERGISKEVAGRLTELTMRGLLASMFLARRTYPSKQEWEYLEGDVEMTMRDFGEISGRLDFDIRLEVTPCIPDEQTDMQRDAMKVDE